MRHANKGTTWLLTDLYQTIIGLLKFIKSDNCLTQVYQDLCAVHHTCVALFQFKGEYVKQYQHQMGCIIQWKKYNGINACWCGTYPANTVISFFFRMSEYGNSTLTKSTFVTQSGIYSKTRRLTHVYRWYTSKFWQRRIINKKSTNRLFRRLSYWYNMWSTWAAMDNEFSLVTYWGWILHVYVNYLCH